MPSESTTDSRSDLTAGDCHSKEDQPHVAPHWGAAELHIQTLKWNTSQIGIALESDNSLLASSSYSSQALLQSGTISRDSLLHTQLSPDWPSRNSIHTTSPKLPLGNLSWNQPCYGFGIISGWWFEPFWKTWKSVGMIIPNIWKNRKCSKPLTRFWCLLITSSKLT